MKHFIDQVGLDETSIEYLVYKLNEVIRTLNNKPDIHDLEYWRDYFEKFKESEANLGYDDILDALKNKPDFDQVREEVRKELVKYIDEVNARIYQPTLEQLLNIIGEALQDHINKLTDEAMKKYIEDLQNRLSATIIYWN